MSIYSQFSEQELAILRARAERLASTSGREAEGEMVTALAVQISGETYALNIEALTAVYDDVAIVPVPGVPSFVAGIANVRGHILPVLDLAVLLGIASESKDKSGNLVVASTSELTVAFQVETIGEVSSFLRGDISSLPPSFTAGQNVYLQGVLPNGTALLDMETILNDPALIVDEAVN
jgi:purine-binding chemotaxis protein CheW